jgi:hypothetical protein
VPTPGSLDGVLQQTLRLLPAGRLSAAYLRRSRRIMQRATKFGIRAKAPAAAVKGQFVLAVGKDRMPPRAAKREE